MLSINPFHGTELPHAMVADGGVESVVMDFEQQLAAAPAELQVGWSKLVSMWLRSPNPRMVAYATTVLQHEKWDPPKWWVAHNARNCRPCLFFPRGQCFKPDCGFCHGSGHQKPRRPNKSTRRARIRQDRTPSPEPVLGRHGRTESSENDMLSHQSRTSSSSSASEMLGVRDRTASSEVAMLSHHVRASSSELAPLGTIPPGEPSAQLRYDRTPSPDRAWTNLRFTSSPDRAWTNLRFTPSPDRTPSPDLQCHHQMRDLHGSDMIANTLQIGRGDLPCHLDNRDAMSAAQGQMCVAGPMLLTALHQHRSLGACPKGVAHTEAGTLVGVVKPNKPLVDINKGLEHGTTKIEMICQN